MILSHRITIEPPLTATSPQQPPLLIQRPLFFRADSPFIDSCLHLSTTAMAKTMASFSATDEKVKNVHEI